MMPPVVPLVLWTSTLLAASSLLAVTSNSTDLGTSANHKALKVNRCCRVCCRVTVSLGRISRHYLMDQKAPYGFPCGPQQDL
uniref:Putative salivary secreted peptide n=1 Tax=Ixodes ricinus TaxID=34613 RepID=V5HBA5_IXORI